MPNTRSGPPIVLVHGAWHGGWCWERVVPRLEAAGREVLALTLPGLGDRSDEAGPHIGIADHVNDIVETLESKDLTDVVLVGHSLGGVAIAGAAAKARGRIRRLVNLDALVPADGQSAFDLSSPGFRDRLEIQAAETGDGWKIQPIMKIFGVTDEADLAWMTPQLKPQPIRTFRDPVHALSDAEAPPSTYIRCLGAGFGETAERCRAKGWPVLELDCGHDAMILDPRGLAVLLLSPECG
jgi:pimeloyl-ACP methyl ester carboxylesterase